MLPVVAMLLGLVNPPVWSQDPMSAAGSLPPAPVTTASSPPEPVSTERIDPRGIPGSLVLCGGGPLPDPVFERFVQLAGGKSARLVVIPSAAANPGDGDPARAADSWSRWELESVEVLHARSRDEALEESFAAPLRRATAVWFGGGQQSRLAEIYRGTPVEKELLQLWQRGGVIGGTSAGAAIQSRLMITGGTRIAETGTGFDFLPDAVIDQHFSQRQRHERLRGVLEKFPGRVGIGIDEETALIVRQRQLEVVGKHQVTIRLAASTSRPAREWTLQAGQVADWTALRRAARERTQPPFPATPAARPIIPHGSLILAGGGRLPLDVVRRFIELAGGPDALIVVLPTAVEQPDPAGASERRMFERAGAKNLAVLAGITPDQVDSPEALATLRQARGIWFGGGRQWRFVDAYQGTEAASAFQDVLRRGGVIGGSSAGASIQAEYLARGSPLGNLEMMAEGYERGLGFLPGVAVDQHFTQRQRYQDMEALLAAHPQLLGIGLDEGSALLVQQGMAEVLGDRDVYFFDRSSDSSAGEPVRLSSGGRYDLVQRKIAAE